MKPTVISTTTHKAMGRVTTKMLFAIFVILAAGLAYWWYQTQGAGSFLANGTPKREGAPPLPVTAAVVKQGNFDIYITALGTVTPLATTVVRPRVDGQLMKIHFEEGQLVKKGDLLAEIDPRPFEVQLAQAEGQLAKDRALLKNAQLDLKRYETLLTQDSIAKQQVDNQRALVQQYVGAIAVDQAMVDSAKLQLTYARTTAPISGRVGMRRIDLGNIVQASNADGLVVITQEDPISVVFTIPEDGLMQILPHIRANDGLPVEAYDRQFQNVLANGKLASIDNQIDTQTGNVKLRAEFSNKDRSLFPNQFVNVRMHVNTLNNVLLVPVAAVARGSQGAFSYVIDSDGTARLRLIKTGASSDDKVVIVSGLAINEQVVVDGLDKLRDGSKVEIIDSSERQLPIQQTKKDGTSANKAGRP